MGWPLQGDRREEDRQSHLPCEDVSLPSAPCSSPGRPGVTWAFDSQEKPVNGSVGTALGWAQLVMGS